MDKLLLLLLIVLTITGFLLVRRLLEPGNVVRVSSENKTVYVLSLDEDRTVLVRGPLGDNVIEIKSRKARIKDATCPDKLCTHHGWIDRGAIICLPNRVVVTVGADKRDERYDAISK